MRRRSLLTAGGLAVPLSLLGRLDDALAVMPQDVGAVGLGGLVGRLTRARGLFDEGRVAALVEGLPRLLAAGHATVEETGSKDALVVLSAAYGLAAGALTKVGIREQARLTADRAVVYAERSEDPLARAAADRQLAIVLRHASRHEAARELMVRAAARVERTGLSTRPQSAAYAQMLCTAAYSAAQAGDRPRALEMMAEATRAARVLPAAASRTAPVLGFSLSAPEVRLYEVGVHYSLGDAGRALLAAEGLSAAQFPTPERRGRLHTDLARAWWQRGRPEETAAQLLTAHRHTPAEVRDRPAVRALAETLISRHPHTPGTRELKALLAPA